MMKKITITAGIIAVFTMSCNSGLSLKEYNDKVIGIYNPIDMRISALGDVANHNDEEKAKDIVNIQSCIKTIDSGRAEIQKITPPKDAAGMHQSVLTLMSYEKDTMLPLITRILKMKAGDADATSLQQQAIVMQPRLSMLIANMQSEQQKLAAKAGAHVQN